MKNIDFNDIYEWPLKTKIIALVVIAIIVFLIGYFWDISSLKDKLRTSKQEEIELKEQLTLVFKKQKELIQDLAQFSQAQMQLKEWEKRLIPSKKLSELLNEILKMGAANQLQFDLFNPEIESKEGLYTKTPIKIVVKGNYRQMADFMSQLANMNWIIGIGQFVISKEEQSQSGQIGNALKGELNLEIYHSDGAT